MSVGLKRHLRVLPAVLLSLALSAFCQAQVGDELIERLNTYSHAIAVSQSLNEVSDHEVGLGAMKKIRGVWQLKASERYSGTLRSHTWQIVDGFSSLDVLAELEGRLLETPGSELLFSCDGRSCGQGVQWANRVFGERILYGREELQRYRAFALTQDAQYRVVLYSSARSADRQYLHMEILQLAPQT